MVLNYTPLTDSLLNGSVTSAITGTYTLSLGGYAFFLAFFATIVLMYVKTQSLEMTAATSITLMIAGRHLLGIIGDPIFYAITVLSLAVVMFKFWKG